MNDSTPEVKPDSNEERQSADTAENKPPQPLTTEEILRLFGPYVAVACVEL